VEQNLILNLIPRIILYFFLVKNNVELILSFGSENIVDLGNTPGSEKIQINKNNIVAKAIVVS
jgi:hypothetical protein